MILFLIFNLDTNNNFSLLYLALAILIIRYPKYKIERTGSLIFIILPTFLFLFSEFLLTIFPLRMIRIIYLRKVFKILDFIIHDSSGQNILERHTTVFASNVIFLYLRQIIYDID